MPNRVSITVGGHGYVLVSEENEDYIAGLARYVDAKLMEQKRGAHMSEIDALILAALTIADEYKKAAAAAESARDQIQGCLEDATRARAEAAELKRELAKRKNS